MKQYIHNTFPVCLRFLCATMLVALSVTACQKEDDTVTLDAVIADQPNRSAKVYVNSFYSYWHNGDNVYINGNTSDDKYTLSVTKASPVIAKIEDVETSTKYTAGYPAEYTEITGNGSLNITLPETQTYELGQIYSNDAADKAQSIVTPMAAYTEGTTLRFHNVGALIKVEIENKINQTMTLYAVEVESDKAPLSGTLAVTATEGGVSIGTTTDGKKRVSMRFSGSDNVVLDASSGDGTKTATIYIPILSIAESQKSNLTVHVLATGGDSKKYTFHGESASDQGVWIARNAMGSISCELNATTCSGENAYFWGKGTPECPYLIENYTDLNNLRTRVNANDATYNSSSVFYLQTADLDLTGQTKWGIDANPAIGTKSYPFEANYDGGNHTVQLNITGISTFSEISAKIGVGLFGTVGGGGKIARLNVKGTISGINRNVYVGAVAGLVSGPFTFDGCSNETNLTTYDNSNYTDQAFGGICGRIDAGTNDVVEIKNCVNDGVITRNNYGHIGGICGRVESGKVTFTSCTNNKTVTSIGTSECYTGGICGYGKPQLVTFKDCVNNGPVSSAYKGLGGILGASYYSANFTGCNNTGDIRSTAGCVGGIVGTGSVNSGYKFSLSNCTNSGIISGLNYVGGLVGDTYSNEVEIDGCTNTGDSVKSTNTGGASYAGGLVGRANKTAKFKGTCSNSAMVEACSTYVGGIIGYVYSGMGIEGTCSNSGNVKSTGQYVGGIIGCDADTLGLLANANVSNTGEVKSTGKGDVGGIAGTISSKYVYIYNNVSITNSGAIQGSGNNVGGVWGYVIGVRPKNVSTGYSITNNASASVTGTSQNVGGIVGNGGKLYFSLILSHCINNGSVQGTKYVGGIVGNAYQCWIDNCGNNGKITATVSNQYSDDAVGGIVGYIYSNGSETSHVSNSYNHGEIEGKGGYGIGGIVGYSKQVDSIFNCYNRGLITSSNTRTGGIVGEIISKNCYIENCYNNGSFSSNNAKSIYGYIQSTTVTVTTCYNSTGNGRTVANENATTTFNPDNGKLTNNQTINNTTCEYLYNALYNWQLVNTSYSKWENATIPRLSWEVPATKRR